MEAIISYLQTQYRPLTIILYGSFADGSNNQNSDFDALLVVEDGSRQHDVSFVDGVQLDVFICPMAELDCAELIQISDGMVILDTGNIGNDLIKQVQDHLSRIPPKTPEEILGEIEWCRKMLSRVERGDPEGYFRWHWLLVDSLEILCDVLRQPYRGPKKSIRWLKENQPDLYERYCNALEGMNLEELTKWIACIAELSSRSPKA